MNDFKSFYEKGKKDGGSGALGENGAFGGTGVNGGNGNGGNYGNCSVGGNDGNGVNGNYANGSGNNGSNGNGNADYRQTADMMAMIAKAFGGKSEAQVWRAILAQAEEGKRNGTLTNREIDNFYATVAPMLDGFKRRKLKEIIEKLKAI